MRFPCVHAVATTPAQRLGVSVHSVTQPYQPSPKTLSGRPARRPFRGLLGVHLRYGLHTRAVTVYRDTLSEGFSHFVTSMTAPVASGWSGCRVGFAPTGKRRLSTAHRHSGHWLACCWLDPVASDPSPTLPLRHPGHAHPLSEALGAGTKRRIVAKRKPFQASDSESGIKRKSLFCSSSRLIQLPEMRERSSEFEMCHGIIWVGLQTLT